MRKILTISFAATLILVVGSALSLGRYAVSALDSQSGVKAVLEIQKGMGPREIAGKLFELKAIDDKARFIQLGRLIRKWGKIKAGEYEVSPALSPIEIFARITSGVSMAHPITVREGQNMYEIAEDMASKGMGSRTQLLALFKSKTLMKSLGFIEPLPPSLEGYLYPETYFFSRTQTPEEMVRQMARLGLSAWGAEFDSRARELGMTKNQVYTLASIIEKETGAPEERPIISAVFHNRLKKKMRLQTDPTAIYGVWERYDGNIHRSTLQNKNPYNTYVINGLPPGPISNPGKLAITAALYPAEVPYLYFVSKNQGTHTFSTTYAEHNAAVRKFQLDPAAREGKSWRDLSRQRSDRGSK